MKEKEKLKVDQMFCTIKSSKTLVFHLKQGWHLYKQSIEKDFKQLNNSFLFVVWCFRIDKWTLILILLPIATWLIIIFQVRFLKIDDLMKI